MALCGLILELVFKRIIHEAIDNLGDYTTLTSIAIDRGFMDGKLLWWLASKKITFFIPAKSNMDVNEDALSLIPDGASASREKNRTTGAGKNKIAVTDS